MSIALILIISLITIIYYYLEHRYKYWERKGVSGPKPRFLLGNIGEALFFKINVGQLYTDIYNKYDNEEIVGVYRTTTPALLLRDPEVIKEVTVRSFNHFRDNDIYIDKRHDALFGRNPFNLKGDEWKVTRSSLTPGFSVAKMKSMYPCLEDSGKKLLKFIEDHPEITDGRGYETKELCTKYTLNNVAGIAFGVESHCFDDDNSSFRQLALEFFSPGNWTQFWFSYLMMIPVLAKVLRLRLITKQVEEKLITLVTETLRYREENNIIRNDFLHITGQLRKSSKSDEFTEIDVAAHAAAFFFDGYETSAQVLSFVLLELARNPKVQVILRDEINQAFEENGGRIPYDLIQTLPYLDGVVNESMRVHSPLFFLQKVCTKTFTFPAKTGKKALTVEEGTPIIVPVHGLHHDAKYYEEPEVFKPERFVGTNKDNLVKYTFLPLGEGPRACLGQRFGLLQIKVGVANIIKHYRLSLNKKMTLPIEFEKGNILTSIVGGIWVDFNKLVE